MDRVFEYEVPIDPMAQATTPAVRRLRRDQQEISATAIRIKGTAP